MRAGALRHTITIQTRTVTRDSYGGETETWADSATVPASVESLSGREYWAARQTMASEIVRFRIRWRQGVTADCRIVWDGRTWDIESVQDPDGRRRELVIVGVWRD